MQEDNCIFETENDIAKIQNRYEKFLIHGTKAKDNNLNEIYLYIKRERQRDRRRQRKILKI